jgi:hypothetical protein
MSVTNEFYRTREAEARRAAESATLDNVRDRHLNAAAAWAAMAVRGERTERRRAETDARKAAAAHDAADLNQLAEPAAEAPPAAAQASPA